MRKIIPILILAFMTFAAYAADNAGFRDTFQSLDQGRWYISDGWVNGDFQSCEWQKQAIKVAGGDMRLTLSEPGGKIRPVGCPELHTNARFGYGLYETRMRSAAGAGLNTAFFTFVGPPNGVPDHDEIDFEFLGKDPHTVQINYFTSGQGQHEVIVPLGFDASQTFHNYAIDWAPDKIRWYVDGKMVSETPAGAKIPHNPGMLFFSLWSGASVNEAWLGHFDYKSPSTADIEWVAYTPVDGKCQFPESLKCK